MSESGSAPLTNSDLREQLSFANDSLRHEIDAKLATTGIQIGAVEKSLRERMDTLKWRMTAALLGGQVLAGVVAAVIARSPISAAARSAAHFIGLV